jgi:hypothetical protein
MSNRRMSLFSCFAAALALAGVAGCEKSTVETTGGRKLTLMRPADQTVKQGASEKFAIVIVRKGFDNPVKIDVDNLPKGVSLVGGDHETIPTGALKIDMTLVADRDAPLIKDHIVTVHAKGPDDAKVTEQFKVTVVSNP